MQLLDRIENQISATGLPLVGITLAAIPCPDTPVILTLHWHGFIKEKLAELPQAEPVSYTPVPSSALQLNDRWRDLVAVDRAAMEAAWELGAWDVARAERKGCLRPGARSTEALECLQAFGAFPYGIGRIGYLMWLFRPVSGGIWAEYADDATLASNGRRAPPCPHRVVPPKCQGTNKMVYRFGIPASAPDIETKSLL